MLYKVSNKVIFRLKRLGPLITMSDGQIGRLRDCSVIFPSNMRHYSRNVIIAKQYYCLLLQDVVPYIVYLVHCLRYAEYTASPCFFHPGYRALRAGSVTRSCCAKLCTRNTLHHQFDCLRIWSSINRHCNELDIPYHSAMAFSVAAYF